MDNYMVAKLFKIEKENKDGLNQSEQKLSKKANVDIDTFWRQSEFVNPKKPRVCKAILRDCVPKRCRCNKFFGLNRVEKMF